MKKKYGIMMVLLFAVAYLYGQSDTIYGKLKTEKFYQVELYAKTGLGKDIYKVNGKRVNKRKYKKYKLAWDNLEKCRPCILEWYDANNNLLRRGLYYTDCGVGPFKTFYKNGGVKVSGSFKENPTNDWSKNDPWGQGYCSVPNGKWTYFNENGDTLYSEFWDNGIFIKQIPEQSTTEIWDVAIKFHNQEADTLAIPIDKVGDLTIHPLYKNSHTDSEITIKLMVSAIGHKIIEKEFNTETFKNIDVSAMLTEAAIPKDKKASFTLIVYSDGKVIKSFSLNVKK